MFDDVPSRLTDEIARELYGMEAGDVMDTPAAVAPQGAAAAMA